MQKLASSGHFLPKVILSPEMKVQLKGWIFNDTAEIEL
jgi:hypothetical protein